MNSSYPKFLHTALQRLTSPAQATATLGNVTALLHRGDISPEQAIISLRQLGPNLSAYSRCEALTIILEELADLDASLSGGFSDFFLVTAKELQVEASDETARRLLLEMPLHDDPISFAYRLPIVAALRASEVLNVSDFAKIADAAALSLSKLFSRQRVTSSLIIFLADALVLLSHKQVTSVTAIAFALMKHRIQEETFADCCQLFCERAVGALEGLCSHDGADSELQYATSSLHYCQDVICFKYPIFAQYPKLPMAVLSLATVLPDYELLLRKTGPHNLIHNSLYTENDVTEAEQIVKKLIKVFKRKVPPFRHKIAQNGLKILCELLCAGLCHENHDGWIAHLAQLHPGGRDFWLELMVTSTLFLIKEAPQGLFLGSPLPTQSKLISELENALFTGQYNQLSILLDFECENIAEEILKMPAYAVDCLVQNLSQIAEKCVACASPTLRLFERAELKIPQFLQARVRLLSIYDIALTCAPAHVYSVIKLLGPDPRHEPKPPSLFFKILQHNPTNLEMSLQQATSQVQQTMFLAINVMLQSMRRESLAQIDLCYKPALLTLQSTLCRKAGRLLDATVVFSERGAYLAARAGLIQSLFSQYRQGGDDDEIARVELAFKRLRLQP